MPDPIQRPGLILTRPAAQARRFAAAVEERVPGRFDIHVAPVLEIVPVAAAPDLGGLSALLFTSENGVRQFADRWGRRDIPALCVGARSAEAAKNAGIGKVPSADGDAGDLAALVRRVLPEGARILHLRGRHSTGALAEDLTVAGYDARDCVLYDQKPRALPADVRRLLGSSRRLLLPLFSPRTARLLAAGLGDLRPAGATALCLSDAVAETLPDGVFSEVAIAARPDAAAMLDRIAEWQ